MMKHKELALEKLRGMGNEVLDTVLKEEVPSIYNIVGKRNIIKYKSFKNSGIYKNIYQYKDIKNVTIENIYEHGNFFSSWIWNLFFIPSR